MPPNQSIEMQACVRTDIAIPILNVYVPEEGQEGRGRDRDLSQEPSRDRVIGQLVEPRTAFICGAVALVLGLAIALAKPGLEPFQLRTFAVTLGLGAASFTSGLNGLLEIKTKWLNAGGHSQYSSLSYGMSPGSPFQEVFLGMSKSGMREQIEYRAWFIRHAGKLALVSFLPAFLLGFSTGLLNISSFARFGFIMISAVVTPISSLFGTALVLRQFHRQERTIKIASIIVYFVTLLSQVWLLPDLVKRIPEEGAAPSNGLHRQSEPARSESR